MAYIKSGQLSRGREVDLYLFKRKGEAEIERSREGEINWNGGKILKPFWTVFLATIEPSPIKLESDSHLLAHEMLQVLIEIKV